MTFYGLLLAGGRSRRMGRDKAWLDFRGTPLWQHQCTLLRAAGCREVLVSGALPGGLPDGVADAGPLAGIDAARRTLQSRGLVAGSLLVIPVDMPLLDAPLLGALAATDAAAAHYAGHPLPLCLRLGAALDTALTAHLHDPVPRRRSLQALLATLQATALPVDSVLGVKLSGANTPAEWAALTQQSL